MPDDFHVFQLPLITADAEYWPSAERLLSLPPEWRIRRHGSFAWLDPLPTFEWYRDFYNHAYREDPTHARLLHNPRIRQRKEAYFRKRLKRIVGALGHDPVGIVDIGAGDGVFLSVAKNAGYRVSGIELCSEAAAVAAAETGAPVVIGDLVLDRPRFAAPIDVVVMHHVFEHLLWPMEYLHAIRSVLQPDGLFVFEIPQQFVNPIDLAYRLLGRSRPFDAYSLHHPYFYSVHSIKALLAMAGYRIVSLKTWLPGQIFHVDSRVVGSVLQGALWVADAIAKKGHVIEVMARPE